MKKIFVINGKPRSGKDTVVKMVGDLVKAVNYDSVGKIKKLALEAGWDGIKDEPARKMLSELKRILKEYNDLPYQWMSTAIANFKQSDNQVMFLHVREPEEIKRLVDDFNVETIFVSRKCIPEINSNESDAQVSKFSYDWLISNEGSLDELKKTVEQFVREVVLCK